LRDLTDALNDISDSIKLAIEFTEKMSFNDFQYDKKTQFAVIRCFEIIGEATKRLPDEYRNSRQDVPWKAMAGMRDRLIHGYDVVDTELVWKTTRQTLPQLLENLQRNN
jgi:uncharacterized protein with HEPN domain